MVPDGNAPEPGSGLATTPTPPGAPGVPRLNPVGEGPNCVAVGSNTLVTSPALGAIPGGAAVAAAEAGDADASEPALVNGAVGAGVSKLVAGERSDWPPSVAAGDARLDPARVSAAAPAPLNAAPSPLPILSAVSPAPSMAGPTAAPKSAAAVPMLGSARVAPISARPAPPAATAPRPAMSADAAAAVPMASSTGARAMAAIGYSLF